MEIILKITPKKPTIPFSDLALRFAQGENINLADYEVADMTGLGMYNYIDDYKNYIIENGITQLFELGNINEDFVPKGASHDTIVSCMQKYLDKIEIDNELIILDPYFYAPNRDIKYAQTILDILEKYLATIDTLIIITNDKIDSTLKSEIENKLQKHHPTLIIRNMQTNNFHDRFWISNKREKGIVTGTSLNGLGRKFALVDRLNISDVRLIIDSLKSEHLL